MCYFSCLFIACGFIAKIVECSWWSWWRPGCLTLIVPTFYLIATYSHKNLVCKQAFFLQPERNWSKFGYWFLRNGTHLQIRPCLMLLLSVRKFHFLFISCINSVLYFVFHRAADVIVSAAEGLWSLWFPCQVVFLEHWMDK